MVKTKQAVLIGLYDDKTQPGEGIQIFISSVRDSVESTNSQSPIFSNENRGKFGRLLDISQLLINFIFFKIN
jgi:hypothetical protein